MTADQLATVALVATVALAPVAIVLIVAMLRGYTVTLHLHRPPRGRRRNQRDNDD